MQLQWCFTHSRALLPTAAAALPPWWRALVPVIGALLGTVVLRLQRRVNERRKEKPEPYVGYVEAVQRKGGLIPLLPNLWRLAAATCSIGTGASIGREGAMIQFGTSMAATLGRFRPFAAFPLNRQVACGVAGAVAVAYKGPLTGVFFASEIALGADAPAQYPTLLLAGFSGWFVGRSILGANRILPGVAALPHPAWRWLLLPLLAVLLGLFGPAYQAIIHGGGGALRRLPLPLLWGGLAAGLLSLADPKVWGNGDAALLVLTSSATPALQPALVILLLRTMATAVCVGVGTVGGVLTPTLFTGASLGLLAAHLVQVPAPLAFVLVGLASLLAAATHAPIMAACMAVELTGAWPLFPVLLACTTIASFVARRLSVRTLYGIASTQPGAAKR